MHHAYSSVTLVLVLAPLVTSKLNTFGKVLACITGVIVSIFQVSKSKHKAREEHQTHMMGEGAEKITPVHTPCLFHWSNKPLTDESIIAV